MNVIVELPDATPVATPEASIVTADVFDELHVPATPVVKVIVDDTFTDVKPLIVGKALTVTIPLSVNSALQLVLAFVASTL